MKIGILQAGHVPPEIKETIGDYTYLYANLLKGHGFTFQTWSVVDMEFPEGPEDADGWLVTGSKHGAYEDHPFIPPLEDLIRQIDASSRPLVGVCFGHQIIAQALGGTVEKFVGGWSIGNRSYEIAGETYLLNAWHQDQVTQPPEDAQTIGSNDFCAHAMLHYKGRALTIQPHPEFNGPVVESLLATRAQTVPQDLQDIARARLTEPDDNARTGNILAHFLKTKSLP